jgi:chaperonin GroEL
MPGMRRRPPPAPKLATPEVVFQPSTFAAIQSGVRRVAAAVRPTLGPLARVVAVENLNRTDAPELLDDGALIARRIVELAPRGADVGGMLLRQALWKMSREAGDGSVTMAVMYESVLSQGIRHATVLGANSMLLRAGLERGRRAVVDALRSTAAPLKGKAQIHGIARSMCYADHEMADALSEIFDYVGAEGLIVVEKGNSLRLEWEYIAGTFWHLSGWFSRLQVTDAAELRTTFENAALLISDIAIREPAVLAPALQRCIDAGVDKLVIVAADISDAVVGMLVRNQQARTIDTLAVRTPRIAEADRVAAMEDIALLTGGRPFYSAAGADFADFRAADLGRARRAWATDSLFGLFGGAGDPRRIRQTIAHLRSRTALAESDHDAKMLQQRIGRLNGATAILRVGGRTTSEMDFRKITAERAVVGLRNAMAGGVVAGGGAALLSARSALDALPIRRTEDELAAQILRRALEEPMRAIVENAGAQPDHIVEKIKDGPPGCGYDARLGRIADMRESGILDSAEVLAKAVDIAVSGAALALTTDVIVHHKAPTPTFDP